MIHIRVVPKQQVHKNLPVKFCKLLSIFEQGSITRESKKKFLLSLFYPLKMIYSIRKLPIPNCIKLKLSAT
jgi:hypothetical protein